MPSGVAPECFREALLERGPACAGATDVGLVRRRNEDAYWIAEDGSALVVADGLGGLPAGDVASTLAVAAVAEFLQPETEPARALVAAAAGPGSQQARMESPRARAGLEQRVREAAAHAQRAVLDASLTRPALFGMATTLALALVVDGMAAVLHVGDSRAALWRNGRLVCTTFDHNAVGDLLRIGALTPEQARHHPERNLVREVIGMPDGYQAECQSWTLEAGDVLVLCTDGVTEAMHEEDMTRILTTAPDAASAAVALVEVAASEGGFDNATAVVRYVT